MLFADRGGGVGVRTPCTLPLDPPLILTAQIVERVKGPSPLSSLAAIHYPFSVYSSHLTTPPMESAG